MPDRPDYLALKWGTVKEYRAETPAFLAALQKWADGGVSMGVMLQNNTEQQKDAICEAIDACSGEIWNDWDGRQMTKDEAKKYVREYKK